MVPPAIITDRGSVSTDLKTLAELSSKYLKDFSVLDMEILASVAVSEYNFSKKEITLNKLCLEAISVGFSVVGWFEFSDFEPDFLLAVSGF